MKCKISSEKPFGGIQVVLTVDFLQLPPVPNHLYNDSGLFCFESKIFTSLFSHKITLKEVLRQKDATFIDIIQQVSVGNVTDEADRFLQLLSRPFSTSNSVKLFSMNEQIDSYNRG
jgi:ATP-dependent DNA helicase PIF1